MCINKFRGIKMFYKLDDKNMFGNEYYKQLEDGSYVSNKGSFITEDELERKSSEKELVEITETEFLSSVMDTVKTKQSLITDYEGEIKKLQFLFQVGGGR